MISVWAHVCQWQSNKVAQKDVQDQSSWFDHCPKYHIIPPFNFCGHLLRLARSLSSRIVIPKREAAQKILLLVWWRPVRGSRASACPDRPFRSFQNVSAGGAAEARMAIDPSELPTCGVLHCVLLLQPAPNKHDWLTHLTSLSIQLDIRLCWPEASQWVDNRSIRYLLCQPAVLPPTSWSTLTHHPGRWGGLNRRRTNRPQTFKNNPYVGCNLQCFKGFYSYQYHKFKVWSFPLNLYMSWAPKWFWACDYRV